MQAVSQKSGAAPPGNHALPAASPCVRQAVTSAFPDEAPGMLLARASHAIFSTREVERLPEVIVREAMRVMGADAVSLMLPGVDGALFIAHAYGIDPEIQKRTRIAVGEGIAGKVAESRQPLILEGGREGRDAPGLRRHGRAKSSIVYPVVSGAELVGVLTFNRHDAGAPYQNGDLGIASVFAAQVRLALDNVRFARQSVSSEKLAAVGALAAGIAHEINTPLQFVGDSVHFAAESFGSLLAALDRYEALCAERGADADDVERIRAECDLSFLRERLPSALGRAAEGVERIAGIVRAVKSFGQPGPAVKGPCDINEMLANVLVISRGEYKDVADVVTHLAAIPRPIGHAAELNQVFLSLIVNAAHAIGAARALRQERGTIAVETRVDGDRVQVFVRDDGCGIPEEIRGRIFEPFFTTKEVGRGTGLGLSIARTIVVDRHGGSLSFESEVGRGTVFQVALPV